MTLNRSACLRSACHFTVSPLRLPTPVVWLGWFVCLGMPVIPGVPGNCALAQSEPITVPELVDTFDTAVKKTELAYLLAVDKLRGPYERAVRSEMDKAMKTGELETVLEFKAELERIEKLLSVPEEESDVAEMARLQQLLTQQIGDLKSVRDGKMETLHETQRKKLLALQRMRTQASDIEGAIEARDALQDLFRHPYFRPRSRLIAKGDVAEDWTVVFRGKDGRRFGERHDTEALYSIPLDELPEDVTHLRFANLDTMTFIVMEIDREGIQNGYRGKNYEWRQWLPGEDEERTHISLAIIDRTQRIKGLPRGHALWEKQHSGWGFGPTWKSEVNEEGRHETVIAGTGVVWDGKPLTSLPIFEIAVTTQEELAAVNRDALLENPAKDRPQNRNHNAVPERLPRSLLVPLENARLDGATKRDRDGSLCLAAENQRGRLTVDLTKLRPGNYDVHVSYGPSPEGDAGIFTIQGTRPTTSARGSIDIARSNTITRKAQTRHIRRDSFGPIQLGGFRNLEVILSPRPGKKDQLRIYRVELTAN